MEGEVKQVAVSMICYDTPGKIAFYVPHLVFVDYFRIFIQYGMRFCPDFEYAIKALHMHEYLRIPDEPNFKVLTNFM